ncbi:DNA-binding response OmpR family regulator [Pedobacter cryoconitis]|uniref:DNA-binding response OmpR family regulator n=1 Tax=Pedobacter cryoconitis TaxID=188932 RepID=A0A7W9DJ10_9SPHI|nr:response regulator transcription factor [Pedobacter cryoconitis]MBB5619660.1 DNA-binding response OmpR family regulator [Pedobacter cryoconitis]MBB5647803.1 DNA-binding response OmpR family regulator [Pedobacter cryoconitis]
MKLLIVEDEPNVVSVLKRGLSSEGFELSVAPDGFIALEMVSAHSFALIILDIMLPGINGLDLCKQIKKNHPQIPIIMLTALSSTENIVTGLDNGADDYLVKPFKIAELSARIRMLLRRHAGGLQQADEIITIGDLQVNISGKTVTRANQEITLTATEYRLLQFFARNKNKTLSRIDILENVWDIDFNMGTNVVDVYVNYLRKKIDKGFSTTLLHTVVGLGYLLKEKSLS